MGNGNARDAAGAGHGDQLLTPHGEREHRRHADGQGVRVAS